MINDNVIKLKPINDLLGLNFLIPSYQRGYRWTKVEVNDLIEDLWEFNRKPNKSIDEFYCLQPVVAAFQDGKWEVIDGQQRLTTILLILKYFNSRFAVEFQKQLYELEYETRPGSADYLNTIDENESQKNIDFYHIYNAFSYIKTWFSSKQHIVNEFESTLLNSTKIIWYEVHEKIDPIDVFTRLNIGKIPLTNAELIKALFLLRDNFKGDDEARSLRQLEIANEWDQIEYSLRNDEFWFFLNDGSVEYDNRIEFIFDLMANKNIKDKDFTFRYFNARFKKLNDIEDAWKEIKDYFLTFQEWFNDRDLFHFVGYLIAIGVNIKQIKNDSSNKSKSQFKEYLKTKIRGQVDGQVRSLNYNDDRTLIKKILLLFNVITLQSNPASNIKFQFGRYKEENWDIEHIHSVQSEMPQAIKHQEDWLIEVSKFTTDQGVIEKIQAYLTMNNYARVGRFEDLYGEIVRSYSEGAMLEDVNDISNLALLDSGTNRGYKNAVFSIKRKTIIERDQNGTFIPLCTKNVFLKYYSGKVDQMSFWGKLDREAYVSDLIVILTNYLSFQNPAQNNG